MLGAYTYCICCIPETRYTTDWRQNSLIRVHPCCIVTPCPVGILRPVNGVTFRLFRSRTVINEFFYRNTEINLSNNAIGRYQRRFREGINGAALVCPRWRRSSTLTCYWLSNELLIKTEYRFWRIMDVLDPRFHSFTDDQCIYRWNIQRTHEMCQSLSKEW